MRQFLVEFANQHLDFQLAELQCVLEMCEADYSILPLPSSARDADSRAKRPFAMLDVTKHSKGDNFEALGKFLVGRCTLVRGFLELWGAGSNLDECIEQTKLYAEKTHPTHVEDQRDKTWKMTIQSLGYKLSREDQNARRDQFRFLDLRGDVKMKDNDNEYVLIEERDLDDKPPGRDQTKAPVAVYFGRVLGDRQAKGRADLNQFSLKKRIYLGPTSMDAELSFIMTNFAKIKQGSFIMDPFAGTGSILLSCGLRGALCLGTDIDIRVLKGRSENENIWSNFAQFQLPRPELVRSDNSLYYRHFLSDDPMYDAIVTDPPYGIRAGARMSGSKRKEVRPVLEKHRHDHIAQTKPYQVSDVMADLLDMAARSLNMNGRLVYVIPSYKEFDINEDLPMHECLERKHVCYQPLSTELGRCIVAMEKIKDYDESQRARYMKGIWKNGPASAEKCANIRAKIMENAKLKPGYKEKAAYRKTKRTQAKESRKAAKRAALG